MYGWENRKRKIQRILLYRWILHLQRYKIPEENYLFSFAYATKASFISHLNATTIAAPHASGPRKI
jgi:hypothetical protein